MNHSLDGHAKLLSDGVSDHDARRSADATAKRTAGFQL
jgi:hypothetical protein